MEKSRALSQSLCYAPVGMRVVFRVHAIKRMFQRGVTSDDVKKVLEGGETVESYPEDLPYPSRLVLGWRGSRPIHVVAAENNEAGETIVITAYEPDRSQWEEGFKRRKK